jgi:hypothetical protein
MYVSPNYKTKKELKEAVKEGVQVMIFAPGPFGGNSPISGVQVVEGPHYPKPHTWCAEVIAENGIVVKVK